MKTITMNDLAVTILRHTHPGSSTNTVDFRVVTLGMLTGMVLAQEYLMGEVPYCSFDPRRYPDGDHIETITVLERGAGFTTFQVCEYRIDRHELSGYVLVNHKNRRLKL